MKPKAPSYGFGFMRILVLLVLGLHLASCVGTDYIEDGQPLLPESKESFMINPAAAALQVGQSKQFEVVYTNSEGIVEQVTPTWSVSNGLVAQIDNNGLATALDTGFVTVTAMANGLTYSSTLNVVSDTSRVAIVTITFSSNILMPGEQIQLSPSAININNNIIDGLSFQWMSSDTSILQVNNQGVLTAKAIGKANITVTAEGVTSHSFEFVVEQNTVKTASLTGLNGYEVAGTATIEKNAQGDVILSLGSDFTVNSFGAAIYVYLSPQAGSVAGGIEIANLTQIGAQSFNVTAINSSVGVSTYSNIIIHCKPFNIPFGEGTFN